MVGLSWQDAHAFCAWLSRKEASLYRLPTDREWSIAVGLGPVEGAVKAATPDKLGRMGRVEFPHGLGFSPPRTSRVGNYADITYWKVFPGLPLVNGYEEGDEDGYVTTAPVMTFKPNPLSFYDLGGNVWEFCEDLLHLSQPDRIICGGSRHESDAENAFSARRNSILTNRRSYDYGFRCVLEAGANTPVK